MIGAESDRQGTDRTFVFAFAPTLAGRIADAMEHGEPLQRYLEHVLERPVRVVVPESYAATLSDLRDGRADAAMLGEFATRQGSELGGIEPLVAPVGANEEIPTYRSVIVTRIDSGIRDLSGARGHAIGLVDKQSTSGFLVPRAMLREVGIDPDVDMTMRLFGRHQLVIEAVIAGEVAVGAFHETRLTPPSLDRGPDYARIRVIARSRPIPLGPLVIRTSLDARTRDRFAEAMLRVHEADPAAADVLIRTGLRFTTVTRPANPTLKSIAALAGVSYVTVSRVVNGRGYVATGTALRVNTVIAELGYVPNGNARVLQGQQAPMIGLLTPFGGGDSGTLVENLAAKGVPLVLCPVPHSLGRSPFLGVARDKRLGALVVGEEHVNDPDLFELARTGSAIIVLGVAHAPTGMVTASFSEAVPTILRAIGWDGRD